MMRHSWGRRALSVVILIATVVVVFTAIHPAIGDACVAAILACLSVLPFASSFLGAGGPPLRKRV
jgi:hypothetical protein